MSRLAIDEDGTVWHIEASGLVIDAVRIDQAGRATPATPTDRTILEVPPAIGPDLDQTGGVRLLAGIVAICASALLIPLVVAFVLLQVVFP